jgi:hypothetical protein
VQINETQKIAKKVVDKQTRLCYHAITGKGKQLAKHTEKKIKKSLDKQNKVW